ncbi:S8 family peptidase [Sphingobium nicotianae]|uniref:S8 family serine peptidase n=1 Tax=Sphingobium nicotianae TaxID=2782607 RepID=A0A9X1DAL4_9SPHN|nr:S8 family peptidase [Sphingobium nicotianae]MBT2186429.1 S8 family serine peptidase [Sphingobium nicotianae]
MTCRTGICALSALTLALSACGGDGGVSSTPTPTPAPTATPTPLPTPTPTPPANYDTAEYRRSNGLSYHHAITAYQAGANGEGITVGIVDSGLSDPAGELAGRISPLSRDFAGNADYSDANGHGTAVANVIAAARNDQHIMGVAWGSTVLALRTEDRSNCDPDGCVHPLAAIASAIDYAWQHGARVVNVSLGGGAASAQVLQAVSRATAAGTIIVVVAGNNPAGEAPLVVPDGFAQSFADPTYSHGLVIIASSVNSNDTVSSFSAGVQGFEHVSLAALGNGVLTLNQNGEEFLYSGTSFAAPQISGAIALLAQAFPNLTSKQIVDLLLSTARDVGAPGADARYGMGILDIAAAFAPKGTLSLAGTGVALAQSTTSALSAPMGDARAAALSAVALDQMQRAYRVDLTPDFRRPGLVRSLTGVLDVSQRHVDVGTSTLRLALSIAPGNGGVPLAGPLALTTQDATQARLLGGTIMARLSPAASVMLGLRTGLASMEHRFSDRPAPSFIMARHGFDAGQSDMRAISALALSQSLAPGLDLTTGFESGDMTGFTRRTATPDGLPNRAAPYHAISMTLGLERRAFGLTAGLTLLDEPASALGARFSPTLGAQSARSLFARLGATIEPGAGITLTANWQRGWTRAAAGGALRHGGSLASQSWSADLARPGVFVPGDLVGLRISQPLRVTASRFDLTLPDAWDWESGIATDHIVPLDLTPSGRQRDYELSYGRGIGPGWLGANLFLRKQSGNIADMPDDLGMALRWSIGF